MPKSRLCAHYWICRLSALDRLSAGALQATSSQATACDVLLLAMPMAPLSRPSMALSNLKAVARREGIACEAWYPGFDFARRIGGDLYRAISELGDPADLVGEWLFAEQAFDMEAVPAEEFLQGALREDWYTVWRYREAIGTGAPLVNRLHSARDQVRTFLESTVERALPPCIRSK